jgi:alanine racemase
VEVAHEVARQGGRALGVATPAEALELREAGVRLPIIVIGSCFEHEIEEAVRADVSLSLSPAEVLLPIIEAAKKVGRPARVHLLVDTGMSRDGVRPESAVELAGHVADTPHLRLEGTYTHLATSSLPDPSFSRDQLGRFREMIAELYARNIQPGVIHCANSGGLFTLPNSHFDMVRQGISLYGVAPSAHVKEGKDLRPAMAVKTRVIAFREVQAGENVGYLGRFRAPRAMRLATISMGYADGLRLALSNKGHVLLHGRRAPVVGRVMMDSTVVDVTGVPGVGLGDDVTVIGRSGRNEITAAELGTLCDSSPYEVLCSFGQRVKRIHVRDGRPVATNPSPAAEAAVEPLPELRRTEPLTP